MGVLLEAKSLKKTLHRFVNFKKETNVSAKNVSLYVNEGEIVGMLGANGAGKSTSLKMITGDLKPDEGHVYFNGEEITDWPMYKRCIAGLGYMAQENTLFKQMTVENNLIGIMQMQGFTQQESRSRCEELMELFNLNHIRNNLATNISGGEKRRLEVARALTRRPKMLILDEPFAGVDPIVTQSVIDLVFELWEKWGIAILITDHDYRHIIQMVQRCYLISDGEVVVEGTPEKVINSKIAKDRYFGKLDSPSYTYDEHGYIRVNSWHSELRDSNSSDLNESFSDNVIQTVPSSLTDSQSVSAYRERQNTPPSTDSGIEQTVSENAPELTPQTCMTNDSELSELLQPVQTNDLQSDIADNQPSATLADFIQTSESPAEETSDQTNSQRQRKFPLSGPTIKPFRRKK